MSKNTETPAPQTIELRSDNTEIFLDCRKESVEESRTIVGYAAKFDSWSTPIGGWFKERISRAAFDNTDVDDVIMCFDHDHRSILARTSSDTLTLSTDSVGLKFSFEAPRTSLGNDILELVKRGDISKCSFKFLVDKDSWSYASKENGQEYDERTVEHIAKLYDVSLVVYPAYKDTEASVRELEQRKAEWLRANEQRDNEDNVDPEDQDPKEQESEKTNTSSRDRLLQFYGLKNKS